MNDKTMTEYEIEEQIINNVAQLGYASAVVVRNARIGKEQGQVDLALFPRFGKKKVILVEAKRSLAQDSKSKVIGQMMMYLTGALKLSEEGIRLYRNYGRNHVEQARSSNRTSPKQVAGTKSALAGWEVLTTGKPITRDQVSVYLATDDEVSPQLRAIVDYLANHHGLHLGLIHTSRDGMRVILKAT